MINDLPNMIDGKNMNYHFEEKLLYEPLAFFGKRKGRSERFSKSNQFYLSPINHD